MKFTETAIPGVLIADVEPRLDERGGFARTFCRREFAEHGILFDPVQSSTSWNPLAGTLRGLHYQAAPDLERKVVRCTRGAIFDAVADLRKDSASYCRWVGTELTADNHRGVYIPAGCAHGFMTLTDHTEVLYLMGEFYDPSLARGVRWDDLAFGIVWPRTPQCLSARDAGYPDFAP